jgi:diguanylate cyclase (GGDEF)-like protein
MRHEATDIRMRWVTTAALLLIAGVVGSAIAARLVAESRSERAQHSFAAASTEVAARLRLTLRAQQDLTVNAGAELSGHPDTMATSFSAWADAVRVLNRYAEIQGIGVVTLVPQRQLAAHLAASGGAVLTPSGRRPFYCLLSAVISRPKAPPVSAGNDFCPDPDSQQRVLRARDTGIGSYEPIKLGGRTWLGVQTPFYRRGAVPTTMTQRRAAFMGWLGLSVDPGFVLTSARANHEDLTAVLRYDVGNSHVVFSSGPKPRHGQSAGEALGNGWTMTSTGPSLPGGVLSKGAPLVVLVAGVAISVLLSVLVFVLATGRARARRLVAVKTDELRHQALHDTLTDLPNRALLLDRISQALHRTQRANTPVAVLFLDLDGFKSVNDTYGHAAGDQLLRGVSARLTGALRDTDTVARLGGDEFVVLAEGSSLAMGPEAIAERIQAILMEPFRLGGNDDATVCIRASIGIAAGPRASADEMLRDADVALYEAKAAGKDCYVVFSPAMQMAVRDRLLLQMDLREAVEQDQLWLAYQPTFDLRTEKITGVEALLRWDHPTNGLIMPDQFIPVAEETGLIVPIGRWVLHAACAQAAHWRRNGHQLSIAVNVSGRQFDGQSDLVFDVQSALAASGLPAECLTLEITETMLMRDALRSELQLRELKALGVRIAIDDFGTGYCSLGYLQDFPVDALKIDRSFITGISSSPEAGALIHTLVQLGKTLGIETYAEGIEVPSQLQHLQNEECDSGQGYLFARPLSADALDDFLSKAKRITPVPVPPQNRATALGVPPLSWDKGSAR